MNTGETKSGFEDVMTVVELAKLLKVHPVWLRRRIAQGGFPGVIRIGKLWRIPRSAYEAVLKNGLSDADGGSR